MTVVEMLIACAVVTILVVMGFNFLYPAWVMSAQGSIRSDMQQQASLSLNQMARDLETSSIGGLGLLPPNGTNPTGFSVVKLLRFAPDGSKVWPDGTDGSAVLYIYFPTQRKLVRKTYPPGPPVLSLPFAPSRPIRIPATDIETIANSTNGTERVLAINVEGLTVSLASPGTSPVTVTLTFRQVLPHLQKIEAFTLRRAISVRNDSL